jgi:hypothetical protein
VLVAVWVSVEVIALVSAPVPVSVSVDVELSVAVTLPRLDDSVMDSVVVTVLEAFWVTVSVPLSQAVWLDEPAVTIPPAP